MSLISNYAEAHHQAYCHPGLEAIYTIEKIDLKTVRPLKNFLEVLPAPSNAIFITSPGEFSKASQLEFDLGGEFRTFLKPLVLEEPIQVLGLSTHAEKILHAHGKILLKDLMELDAHQFIFFRGMGQGHIDEIEQKLQKYLSKHQLTPTKRVDWVSLVRVLAGSSNRKRLHVLMERFGLADLFTLTPAENVEIRRFTLENCQQIESEVRDELHSPKNAKMLNEILNDINDVLIKPWMRQRQGLVTKNELIERLERVSEAPQWALDVLNFISSVFLKGQFILGRFLIEIHPGLFSVDNVSAATYQQVVEKALSYYYKETLCYPFEQLSHYIQKEFALQWQDTSELSIKKILSLSPHFQIYKNSSHQLMVKLS